MSRATAMKVAVGNQKIEKFPTDFFIFQRTKLIVICQDSSSTPCSTRTELSVPLSPECIAVHLVFWKIIIRKLYPGSPPFFSFLFSLFLPSLVAAAAAAVAAVGSSEFADKQGPLLRARAHQRAQ